MINYNEWNNRGKLEMYKKLLSSIVSQGGIPDANYTSEGIELYGFPLKQLLEAGVLERSGGHFRIVPLQPSEVLWMMK